MSEFAQVRIGFHSWWRTSSGQTDGYRIDDKIERSAEGLPWLPGRTLKGLLRDAADQLETLGHFDAGIMAMYFGRSVEMIDAEGDAAHLEARHLTTESMLRVGSAQLDENWRRWARWVKADGRAADRRQLAALFSERVMTAIERGVARTGSLRRVETAVPLDLTAPVWLNDVNADVDEAKKVLDDCCRFIKSLGAGRNRGFGRVVLSLEDAA